MKDRVNRDRFSSPAAFYPLAGTLVPYFAAGSVVFGLAGLWLGMLVAPTDFQQGEGYRIIFIHVPASWMSMFIYLVMAFWAAIGLAFNTRLSGMMAQALAPTGALTATDTGVAPCPPGPGPTSIACTIASPPQAWKRKAMTPLFG